ncbi:SBBP repeat-containing protein, partial [Candidatus Omnitrophota bacterium]
MKKLIVLSLLLAGFLLPGGLFAADVTEEWVKRYDGPANGHDHANAIAVDSAGNVYVTGCSLGIGAPLDYDYATIKYAPDGTQLWVNRYDGPGESYEIALDSSGNVYVTGYSYGIGTDNDYATIKYDTNGTQLWVARYNG